MFPVSPEGIKSECSMEWLFEKGLGRLAGLNDGCQIMFKKEEVIEYGKNTRSETEGKEDRFQLISSYSQECLLSRGF